MLGFLSRKVLVLNIKRASENLSRDKILQIQLAQIKYQIPTPITSISFPLKQQDPKVFQNYFDRSRLEAQRLFDKIRILFVQRTCNYVVFDFK
jgi:hypothetical protein